MNVRRTLLLIGFLGSLASLPAPVEATDWAIGDVFAAVGGGMYRVYRNDGTFKETISDGLGGFTTGCAFGRGTSYLSTTNFTYNKVVKRTFGHPHDIVQIIDTTEAEAQNGLNESIVFDAAGNFYVGHPDGNRLIHKYNASGTLQETFSAAIEDRGTDWIDLTADQTTIFYTSEGRLIKRFNVSTNTQLVDFATLPGTGTAFALRLLPPDNGSGGLLVADTFNIKRLDGSGNVLQTYDVSSGEIGEDSWFALALDPNGKSFWAGDSFTGNFYRFNIASGAVEVGPIATFASNPVTTAGFGGICVKGARTVNTIPLSFPAGTNVTEVANFNPKEVANHHSWKARVGQVVTPFTLALSATETACGNGCPSGIENDPSDFQCRFLEYFSHDSQLPKPVPYTHHQCVFYRAENPPPGLDIIGSILDTIGYNEPAGLGTSYCGSLGAATRLLLDPSLPPPADAALNHSFVFDYTNFFNPAGKPGDPTVSGRGKTFSDYVVACRFPIGSAVFLKPRSGGTFNAGSSIPFMVRVKNSTTGAFITDAATAPNSMPLSIFFRGVLIPTFGNPGSSPGFWTYDTVNNVYTANAKTPKGAAPGSYTACIDSFRNPTAIPSPPPYFAHTCVTFTLRSVIGGLIF